MECLTLLSVMMSFWKNLWDVELVSIVELASISAISKGTNNTKFRDGYSMDPLLPKKEGICDNCGHNLVIREDDTEKVISARMKEYEAKTKPLLSKF